MKKNYVMPQMKVVKINQRSFIMASDGTVHSVSGNADLEWGGGGNYEGRSRDYDDWDEE
jgi:hypothetical protein